MTIEELYKWAKKKNALNKEITVSYTCSDDWYNYCEDLSERQLTENTNEVIIDINTA